MNSKKKNLLIFAILFLITNLIFLPWLVKEHMSTDSYKIFDMGYQEYNKHFFLLDGRFMSAGLTYLMDIFDIPIVTYSSISLEIAILVSCLSVIILVNTVKKWKMPKNLWNEITLIFASYYTIFNFLYIENLHFVECGSMVLSILLFILSAKQIVEKNKMWGIKAFLLLCIALMCYQGTISMFVITLLVFSMCKGNSGKQIAKDFFQGMLIALAGILVSQVSIKVVEQIYHLKQGRDINLSTMGKNIIYNFSNMFKVIKNTANIIPRYSFLITLGITELLMIFKVVKQNKEKQDRKNADIILEQLAIIGIGIVAGFIVSIINVSGFWAGRARFSIGALIGFLWIHLWVKTNFIDKRDWLSIGLMICLFTYGLMNSLHYITAVIDHTKLNELDKEAAIAIQKDVIIYEKENHTEITKVAIVVKNSEWSAAGCYNYYTNSKLDVYKPTEVEKQEYLEENKEYLCIGDTLYITTYMH